MTEDKIIDNSRVTTREFYAALLLQNDRMDKMERRILDRIDGANERFATKEELSRTQKAVDGLNLRVRSIWDVGNSLGVLGAWVIAWFK
jgi:hypothetical protein